MSNNIEKDDILALREFLDPDNIPRLTNGAKNREFEAAWNEWLGTRYSVLVNSGSSANILTVMALRELKKDGRNSVIVPGLGWVSDVSSVIHARLKPQFCDINLSNLSYDVEQLEKTITEDTKAIMAVSVLGINCYTDKMLALCKKHNLFLIGDHCESHGTTFKGKKLGSLSEEFASNFSFFMAHHATTICGGMISTNNEEFYDYLRSYRSHSMVREMDSLERKNRIINENPELNKDFIFLAPGYNMRATEIAGVLGLNQLKKLDRNNEVRKKNFAHFIKNLDPNKYITSLDIEGQCNYAFIIILKKPSFESRDALEKALREAKIEHRRGSSGGGNQTLQVYCKQYFKDNNIIINQDDFPNLNHIHHFSCYVGNYASLEQEKIDNLLKILNSLDV